MSHTPNELKYASTHEWARLEEDGTVTVGITDHAQAALGDVVFVETPEVGAVLAAGDEAGVVESVKAASDIYSPLAGEVIAINQLLEDDPETVNAWAMAGGKMALYTGLIKAIAPTDDDIWSVEYYQGSTHVTGPERQAFANLTDVQEAKLDEEFSKISGA